MMVGSQHSDSHLGFFDFQLTTAGSIPVNAEQVLREFSAEQTGDRL